MTQLELEKLPPDQQQSALLAIALGLEIEPDFGVYGAQPIVYSAYLKICAVLASWKPSENKALMWDLVCELRNVRTILFTDTGIYSEYHGETESYLSGDISCDLIAAYISADPKGNIAKFYLNKGEGKENELA